MLKTKINSKSNEEAYDELNMLGPISSKLTTACSTVLIMLLIMLCLTLFLVSSPDREDEKVVHFLLKSMNVL